MSEGATNNDEPSENRRRMRFIASLDLRALALFRITLGLVVTIDALWRLVDVEAFYTDVGTRPRHEPILESLWQAPSLYAFNGSIAYASVLLIITALVGLVFAAGYRTTICAVAQWVLVISVQNRNPQVESGADSVLGMLCLLACFLPLAARFSFDAKRTITPREQSVSTWATFAFVLQLVVIYLFNVVNKLEGDTWRAGTAVMRALSIDQHTTPFGYLVFDYLRWANQPLTYGALVIETSVLLLLVPFTIKWASRIRVAIIASMWALHIGFAVCLYLQLFSPICMIAWLALLPSSVFDRGPIASLLARTRVDRALAPGDGEAASTPIPAAVALAVMMALQCAANLANTVHATLPEPIAVVTRPLRIGQLWKMFAPNPRNDDGWWVVPGTLENGDVVDLFRDGASPVTFEKPRYVSELYKNGRWRQMLMARTRDTTSGPIKPYARWLCRTWNRTHDGDQRLDELTVVFMHEKTRRDFKTAEPVRQEMLPHYRCPSAD